MKNKIKILFNTPTPPNTLLPVVTVVTATDKNYFPHLATMLASLLKNANRKVFIDIIILIVDLEEEDKKYLLYLEQLHSSCKINFFDMSNECKNAKEHPYLPRVAYFRIVMADLLKNYHKVIYLDPDTIVISDISELFNTDISDHYAAACPDLIVKALCYNKHIRSNPFTNSLPAKIYCSEYLKIDFQQYFQSGVMLMNLQKFREAELAKVMLADAENNHFWFADQCILNKHLFGKVKFIDCSWNVTNIEKDLALYLPDDLYHLSDQIVQNPKIIHFNGFQKPWIADPPFANYYWFYLKETRCYETIFNQRFHQKEGVHSQNSGFKESTRKTLLACWNKLPVFIQKLIFPIAQFVNHKLQR